MYVDFDTYQKLWGGRLSYEAFTQAEPKAEAHIRYLTYLNGDVFAKQDDNVKRAVCAATDVVAQAEADAENRAAGTAGIKSESNDGYSVTYVTDMSDGQTADQAILKRVASAVRIYLLPGGWLYRGLCRR